MYRNSNITSTYHNIIISIQVLIKHISISEMDGKLWDCLNLQNLKRMLFETEEFQKDVRK